MKETMQRALRVIFDVTVVHDSYAAIDKPVEDGRATNNFYCPFAATVS